jgi:hypothetical protein
MVVGGHLDSWDLLMVLMMTEQEWCKVEVLNIFKNLGINLKYDSRSSFMNEENGLRGKIRGVILVE